MNDNSLYVVEAANSAASVERPPISSVCLRVSRYQGKGRAPYVDTVASLYCRGRWVHIDDIGPRGLFSIESGHGPGDLQVVGSLTRPGKRRRHSRRDHNMWSAGDDDDDDAYSRTIRKAVDVRLCQVSVDSNC